MKIEEYYNELDRIVYDCIKKNLNIDQLLANSDGASPFDIKKSISRLQEQNLICNTDILSNNKLPPFYKSIESKKISHLLDGDWKFNYDGIQNIIDCILNEYNNTLDLKICFIGTPSIFRECNKKNIGLKRVFIDKNALNYSDYLYDNSKEELYPIDIFETNINSIISQEYDLIIMDPPWYEKIIYGFFVNAQKIIKVNGKIFCAYPKKLTRPSIEDEFKTLKKNLEYIKIEYMSKYDSIVKYSTPLFEETVLQKEGINLYNIDWRYADLLVFINNGNSSIDTKYQFEPVKLDWNQIICDNAYYKYKKNIENSNNAKEFISSIFPNDILPTISTREYTEEISKINLWTSSNRVFHCKDIDLFVYILTNKLFSDLSSYQFENILERFTQYKKDPDYLKKCIDVIRHIHINEQMMFESWIKRINMSKKFIISDFDGTIRSKNYTDKNISSIIKINTTPNMGFIICTGRNFNYIKEFVNSKKIRVDYYICSNGATIYDKSGNIISEICFDDASMNQIKYFLKVENKYEVSFHSSKSVSSSFLPNTSMMIVNCNNCIETEKLKKYFPSMNCFSDKNYLFITPPDATKEKAIKILQKKGVDNISYLGDSESDILPIKLFGGFLIKKNENNFCTICSKQIIETEIMNYLRENHPQVLGIFKNHSLHLGVFTEPYITKIFSGDKTMESRFSMNKIAPYNKISSGDFVFIKRSSGGIEGFFQVGRVLFYDMTKTKISDIENKYNDLLSVDDSFWEIKKNSKFSSILEIRKVWQIKPFKISKKGMLSWICI